tara:strand:- start:126 stop:335 length:210 start_codon:yes stop_codon:yes gene_type:complete
MYELSIHEPSNFFISSSDMNFLVIRTFGLPIYILKRKKIEKERQNYFKFDFFIGIKINITGKKNINEAL